ncbi:MAG: hypothetical protein CR993_00095 [Rhodobacterales bacterium]|nr:MAG: hypothetical protein CR993_00095 [Rhodobacterales bacterium]
MSAWIILILAGLFEIGWPIGLKNAAGPHMIGWGLFAVVCMGFSGVLLFQAQKTIPIGTAYAVWTGIGAVGTFAVGIAFFGDSAGLLRIGAASLIVLGVIGLKVVS